MTFKFKLGDRVRIQTGDPPHHIRTPAYVQGKVGVVERLHGTFRNPESLAHGGDGLPKVALYLIRIDQTDVWDCYQTPQDALLIDIYEHWLEAAQHI